MLKFHWSVALRRATSAGVLMSALGTGLAAFGQNGLPHPPDAPAATVPPAPTGEAPPAAAEPTAEEPAAEEPAAEEEEETEDEPACDFLMRLFDDECGNNFLDDHGLKISGWIAQSYTFNGDHPDTKTNGPVTFTDRANEYQLNQLYFIAEKTVDQSAEELQIGGRVDSLFGSDYFFTTARGLELEQDGTHRWNRQKGPNRTVLGPNNGRLHGFALPQAYAEIAGYDSSIKIGHFYTIIGNEVVTAPQNFFVTHAYTMQYGEPFTHTGVLWNYKLNDNWSINNGIVQGWDNFDDTNNVKSYLGGVTYTNEDSGTTVAFAIIHGEERLVFDVTDPQDRYRNDRTMYSIVLTQAITDKLTYVIQHDNGQQQGAILKTDDTGFNYRKKAEWYGINQYLFYQLTDNVKAGVRYEWFRDDDGYRVLGDDEGCHYHELSVGLNLKLADCVMLRPECRYDWAKKNGQQPYDLADDGDGGRVSDDGHQFLFTTDLIISY